MRAGFGCDRDEARRWVGVGVMIDDGVIIIAGAMKMDCQGAGGDWVVWGLGFVRRWGGAWTVVRDGVMGVWSVVCLCA